METELMVIAVWTVVMAAAAVMVVGTAMALMEEDHED